MQRDLVIHYPAILAADSFESAVCDLKTSNQHRHPTKRFIYGTMEFASLDVLVSSLFLYNELAASGTRVTLEWAPGSPTFRYAERMGFFRQLSPEVSVLPYRPPPIGTSYDAHLDGNLSILELTPIILNDRRASAKAALVRIRERLSENLAPLQSSELVENDVVNHIWTCASETLGNIYDHSKSPVPGVVAAQRYVSPRRGPRLQLVIADGGLGIPATIRAGNPTADTKTDADIIQAAFREGLSSVTTPGRGCGLTSCAKIARRYHGNLRVRAGRTFAKLVTHPQDYGLTLAFFESSATPIRGTQLTFDFFLDRMPMAS
jgi:anti-sigma regulatory factor (Ser/Thr protein kinase)